MSPRLRSAACELLVSIDHRIDTPFGVINCVTTIPTTTTGTLFPTSLHLRIDLYSYYLLPSIPTHGLKKLLRTDIGTSRRGSPIQFGDELCEPPPLPPLPLPLP